jgi:hypothetical protein
MIIAYTLSAIADENVLSRQQRDSKSANRMIICCADANHTFKCGQSGGDLSLKREWSMKLGKTCAGAVAFFALASGGHAADLQPVLKAPAAVDQQATGYVEVYTGWASTTLFGSERFDGWALGGAGRGNYWVSRDMSVQVDAQAEGTSHDIAGDGVHISTHSYLVGGHLSWRNPQQYLFGLFGAVGDAGGLGFTENLSQRHGLIGAEAQWYWNQFTLYGQVGYDSTLNSFSGLDSINAWFIRGTGRYFVNPNFLIEGTVMYANGDIDFNSVSFGFETWSWQAKAEWRLPTAPFSIYAKYQGSETKYDNNFLGKAKDDRVLLGLKLHLGDRTLQQTDRAGATLDIISPLANPTSPVMNAGGGVTN